MVTYADAVTTEQSDVSVFESQPLVSSAAAAYVNTLSGGDTLRWEERQRLRTDEHSVFKRKTADMHVVRSSSTKHARVDTRHAAVKVGQVPVPSNTELTHDSPRSVWKRLTRM